MGRREEILEAGLAIVKEGGIEALHARSVAARVGINHAAVHYYFARRTDLILGVSAAALEQFSQLRASLLEQHHTRWEAHLMLVEALAEDETFIQVLCMLFGAAKRDAACGAEFLRLVREWVFTLRLDTRGYENSTSPFVDPDLLVSTFIGLLMLSVTTCPPFSLRPKLIEMVSSMRE